MSTEASPPDFSPPDFSPPDSSPPDFPTVVPEPIKVDDETFIAIQRVQDDLVKALSKRSWLRKRNPPELQTVYGVIYNNLVEIQRMLILRQTSPPANFKVIEQQVRSFLNDSYDDLLSMEIHGAWEYAAALERFLLLLGDDEYIFTRLTSEGQREKKLMPGSWSTYLTPETLTGLLEAYKARPVRREVRSRAVECLAFLYAGRSRYLRHQRTLEEIKASYFHWFILYLAVLLLLLLQCVYLAEKGDNRSALGFSKSIVELLKSLVTFQLTIDLRSTLIRNALVAAATGALGSTLSGFYKLRDEKGGLNVLRSFRAAMWAQPFVGAVVGTLLLLVLQSGIVTLGKPDPSGSLPWSNLAFFCFLAGFSEPFFLGIVQRVAGAADKAPEAAGKKKEEVKPTEGEKTP
jgi:hypothetical protein